MSKRTTKQLSQRSKEKDAFEKADNQEEKAEEKITKKSFSSTAKTSTTDTKILPKLQTKQQPAKMTLSELKNLKNVQQQQESILVSIENNNIQEHVQNLLQKFDPPQCINCSNRRADRVCINKACGLERYMQIICGKCHFNEHQSAINKSEMDVEEFFIKLATFVNETKHGDQKKQQQRIDLDNLETVFDDLDQIRSKLASLRSQIQRQIESHTSPAEMQSVLQSSISKALSLCEYDNIQEQLLNVKKNVLFENNKFLWNDAGQKSKELTKCIRNLEDSTISAKKTIQKSFVGGIEIYLDELVVKYGYTIDQSLKKLEFKGKDGELKIEENQNHSERQCYLDYNLEKDKKYKLRFRFENQPTSYIMVGVMEKKQCLKTWITNTPNQRFLKRFLSPVPSEECSRILKGTDLSLSPMKGQQIEMRIDFENDYVDFYDYPGINNVNANIETNKFSQEQYVFTFILNGQQTVILESLSEVSTIQEVH